MLSNVVNLDDVRMLEPGDGLALPAKSLPLGRRRGPGEDHLQGDDADELRPACLVDDSQAAATEDAQDLIARGDLGDASGPSTDARDCGPGPLGADPPMTLVSPRPVALLPLSGPDRSAE